MQANIKYPRGTILQREIVSPLIPSYIQLYHEGILVDEDTQEMIHVIGFPMTDSQIPSEIDTFVRRTSLEVFMDGKTRVRERKTTSTKTLEEIAKAAEEWVDKPWRYNLISSNCETFTNLCALDQRISYQTTRVAGILFMGTLFSALGSALKSAQDKDVKNSQGNNDHKRV
jgi:hypothetical protein